MANERDEEQFGKGQGQQPTDKQNQQPPTGQQNAQPPTDEQQAQQAGGLGSQQPAMSGESRESGGQTQSGTSSDTLTSDRGTGSSGGSEAAWAGRHH